MSHLPTAALHAKTRNVAVKQLEGHPSAAVLRLLSLVIAADCTTSSPSLACGSGNGGTGHDH